MERRLEGLRPVVTQPESDFGRLMGRVLSPARPLQSAEFLRGREAQLAGIQRALYQTGRHILIHGLRGVGKSSLAQTAAYQLANASREPIIIGCDSRSTFSSVIREIFDDAENKDPRIESKLREVSSGFSRFGLHASGKISLTESAARDPGSINEAVRLMNFLSENWGEPVIVIDEFDLIRDSAEQEMFTSFIKQVSDRHVPARFIFCGIGQSAEAIMTAHGSADRYFHTVELGQLPWEARFEIVTGAADHLGIGIDRDTVIRIARISDGFPHYVHFIAEKLFWRVYEAENDGNVTSLLFEQAMHDAARSMDIKLRGPYETATRKYRDEYEAILWAVADGHELVRRSAAIYDSYLRIMDDRRSNPLDRTTFNRRINSLKQENHACILTGSRQGWYEFTEKMIRGYVRLRAEQKEVDLEVDHPSRRRRDTTG